MTPRAKQLRDLIVKSHPEWKGKVWIHTNCIAIRGLCTTWWREPEDTKVSVETEAKWFIYEFEWHQKHEH